MPILSQVRIKIESDSTGNVVGHFWLRLDNDLKRWVLSVWLPTNNWGVVADGDGETVEGSKAILAELLKFAELAHNRHLTIAKQLQEKAMGVAIGTHQERKGFRKGYTESLCKQWDERFKKFKRKFEAFYNLNDDNILYKAGWPKPYTLPALLWAQEEKV